MNQMSLKNLMKKYKLSVRKASRELGLQSRSGIYWAIKYERGATYLRVLKLIEKIRQEEEEK